MKYEIRIASPCTANWNLMNGDDRIRHCTECHLSVHNFSRMSDSEIDDLLDAHEGRICARFYQRADGTMLTQNCPEGVRRAFRNASRIAATFLSAAFTLGPALAVAAPPQKQTVPLTQIRPAPSRLLLIVLDPSGAVISNAKVALTNESSGLVFSGDTDNQGELHLSALPHANYKIVISASGFRSFTAEGISLPVKTPPRYTLEIGALMGEVVIVDNRNPVQKFFSHLRHIL
jgi:hypothetical protein